MDNVFESGRFEDSKQGCLYFRTHMQLQLPSRHTTSFQHRRFIDFETTSCVYWVHIVFKFYDYFSLLTFILVNIVLIIVFFYPSCFICVRFSYVLLFVLFSACPCFLPRCTNILYLLFHRIPYRSMCCTFTI